MDLIPEIPPGRKLITSYGDGRFRIAGEVYEHPVIVFADAVLPWSIERFEDLTFDSLQPMFDHQPPAELLLVGCGKGLRPLSPALKQSLKDAGLSSDPMDTGAACRTFNLLMAEGRRVAAALIPV